MAYEAPSHEELYRRVKAFLVEHRTAVGRIDLQHLADLNRVSVTPVREALCRLVGERLVERHPGGGFAFAPLDAGRLRDLYAWNGHHLLAALHLLPSAMVLGVLKTLEHAADPRTGRDPQFVYRDLERAIADATGIAEFRRAVDASSIRLERARKVERLIFTDGSREVRRVMKTDVSDVKNNLRRRISAYHRRRIEHAGQIASLLHELPSRIAAD